MRSTTLALLLSLTPLTAGAALALPAAPGLSPVLMAACEHVIGETTHMGQPCEQVTATGLSSSGLDVSVSNLSVQSFPPCPPMTGASIVVYRDRDGVKGFMDPPDQLVSSLSATQGTPVDSISLGAFSNSNTDNGRGDHWELRVSHSDGNEDSVYSGTF